MRLRDILLRHGGKISTALIVLIVGGWFLYAYRGEINRQSIEAFGNQLPVGWFVLAYLILPLCGFPVSILLVLAGVRFGLGWGMAIVAVGMLFHHYTAFYLTHSWFRDKLRSFLERVGYGIPAIKQPHRVWFTAVFAAVHGPPILPSSTSSHSPIFRFESISGSVHRSTSSSASFPSRPVPPSPLSTPNGSISPSPWASSSPPWGCG